MRINWKESYIEQLAQLTQVTFDGDLICKLHRNKLVERGYAKRVDGFNFITVTGIILLNNLGVIRI